MDKMIYQAHSCDAVATTTGQAQYNLKMFAPTIKPETVQCMDEEDTNQNDYMYPYKPLGSLNCVNYYDDQFCVSEEMKKEFPEDECSQSSTSVPCINECSINSKIVIKNEEPSKVLETQELHHENSEGAFSFIKTGEIQDKKNQFVAKPEMSEEHRILDNAGVSGVLSKLRTTQEILPKMCSGILKKRLNLLTHSNEHLQVKPPTTVGNERNELGKCECCNEYSNIYRNMLADADDVYNNKKPKPHKCDLCEHILKRKSALVKDTKNIYYDSAKLFECWCGKQFRTPKYLSRHNYRQHGRKVENTNNAAIKKELQCYICKKMLTTKGNLKVHITNIHYDYGKTFDCWCGKQFRTPKYLSIHEYSQHGRKVEKRNNAALKKEFQCDICKKIFKSKEVLKIHLKSIHFDYGKTFDCWCGKQFRTPRHLYQHKSTQHRSNVNSRKNTELKTRFQCDICKKMYRTKRNLGKHIRNIHYDYGKRFECLCGKQFRTPRCLSNHKYRQHGSRVENTNNATIKKEFLCDICKKFFKSKCALKMHVKGVHYDYGKTFDCWCGKQFRTPRHLSDHKYRQHGPKVENTNNAALETVFQCDFCKRKFQRKGDLRRHIIRIHYDYGKRFECWCGKEFRTPRYLSAHKHRQHGPKVENTNNAALETDFQCDFCKRKFQSKGNLRRHIIRIHYDYGKRFECWCGKEFRTPRYLSAHKHRQHGPKVENTNKSALKKELQCDICKKLLKGKNNLRRHITSIHYDYGKRFEC